MARIAVRGSAADRRCDMRIGTASLGVTGEIALCPPWLLSSTMTASTGAVAIVQAPPGRARSSLRTGGPHASRSAGSSSWGGAPEATGQSLPSTVRARGYAVTRPSAWMSARWSPSITSPCLSISRAIRLRSPGASPTNRNRWPSRLPVTARNGVRPGQAARASSCRRDSRLKMTPYRSNCSSTVNPSRTISYAADRRRTS